jgi:GT2 family glycosyltransferase
MQISGLLPAWAEAIVLDNASLDGSPELVAGEFPRIRLIRLKQNLGTAARNIGLKYASGRFILMLDNDSFPLPGALDRIENHFAGNDRLGALGGAIMVQRNPPLFEAGGLPGVFVGCGVVFRIDAIKEVGGYPRDYGYYVEEYDVSCRLWQAGWEVAHAGDIPIFHGKVSSGRDMNRILRSLVRNNINLWGRYAPQNLRRQHIQETILRYFRVARLERAVPGYFHGLLESVGRIIQNRRCRQPMTAAQHDSLYGLDSAASWILQAKEIHGPGPVVVYGVDRGMAQIVKLLREANVDISLIVDPRANGPWRSGGFTAYPPAVLGSVAYDWIVIGSLSPGNAINLATQAATIPNGRPAVVLSRFCPCPESLQIY